MVFLSVSRMIRMYIHSFLCRVVSIIPPPEKCQVFLSVFMCFLCLFICFLSLHVVSLHSDSFHIKTQRFYCISHHSESFSRKTRVKQRRMNHYACAAVVFADSDSFGIRTKHIPSCVQRYAVMCPEQQSADWILQKIFDIILS